jgi:hypothetical protein
MCALYLVLTLTVVYGAIALALGIDACCFDSKYFNRLVKP